MRPTLAFECRKLYPAVMDAVDLNLLTALDVLLAEGSVIGAARRLGLSLSAMSRTLERLRRAGRYAACGHVVASQVGEFSSPTDAALEELQLSRTVQVVVPGFPDAMRIAANSDLVALVPHASLRNTFITNRVATMGLQQFEIPIHTPEILISALWHPRVDADPAQRWLRQVVVSVCKGAYPATGVGSEVIWWCLAAFKWAYC